MSGRGAHLLFPLPPRELHCFGVDDDDVITAVVVGAESRLVLSADDRSDLSRETSYDLLRRALRYSQQIKSISNTGVRDLTCSEGIESN